VVGAVLRDAWRQYRRRPLAAPLALAVGGLPVFLPAGGNPLLIGPVALALLVVGLLADLFLVAWMAAALDGQPSRPAEAVRAMRRSAWPGIRAGLLRGLYLLAAWMVGRLLFGDAGTAQLSHTQQAKLSVGLWPLFAFALALLAVIDQRIVLDGERLARRAAVVSYRVAVAHFPLCLAIGLVQALGLVVTGLPVRFAVVAAAALLLSLADPFLTGMGNALYLRAGRLQPLRPGERA
jgi:hypothetical protein